MCLLCRELGHFFVQRFELFLQGAQLFELGLALLLLLLAALFLAQAVLDFNLGFGRNLRLFAVGFGGIAHGFGMVEQVFLVVV